MQISLSRIVLRIDLRSSKIYLVLVTLKIMSIVIEKNLVIVLLYLWPRPHDFGILPDLYIVVTTNQNEVNRSKSSSCQPKHRDTYICKTFTYETLAYLMCVISFTYSCFVHSLTQKHTSVHIGRSIRKRTKQRSPRKSLLFLFLCNLGNMSKQLVTKISI